MQEVAVVPFKSRDLSHGKLLPEFGRDAFCRGLFHIIDVQFVLLRQDAKGNGARIPVCAVYGSEARRHPAVSRWGELVDFFSFASFPPNPPAQSREWRNRSDSQLSVATWWRVCMHCNRHVVDAAETMEEFMSRALGGLKDATLLSGEMHVYDTIHEEENHILWNPANGSASYRQLFWHSPAVG